MVLVLKILGGILAILVLAFLIYRGYRFYTRYDVPFVSQESDYEESEEDAEVGLSDADVLSVLSAYREGDALLKVGDVANAAAYYQNVAVNQGEVSEALVLRRALTLPLDEQIAELLIIANQEAYSGDTRARAFELITLRYLLAESEVEKGSITTAVFALPPFDTLYKDGDAPAAYAKLLERAATLGTAPLAHAVVADYYYRESDRFTAEGNESAAATRRRIADEHKRKLLAERNVVTNTIVPAYQETLSEYLAAFSQ